MPQKLSNLPVGAKVKFGKHQIASETAESISWIVADKNHSGYPADSVTVITQELIDILPYDAKEGSTYQYGNPNYALSNIHQWLNSSASAGNWYSPTHANDVAPTNSTTYNAGGYQSRAGFLYNFTDKERSLLLPTTITNQLGNDVSTTITAKVFLPSEWELLGKGQVEDNSSQLSYFSSKFAVTSLTAQAYTYCPSSSKPASDTSYYQYYTRSTVGGSENKVRCVNENGLVSLTGPNGASSGTRPVINLAGNLKMSDTTDADGCYTVLSQTAPEISGMNTNLGVISTDFSGTDVEVVANPYLEDSLLGFRYPYVVEDIDDNDSVTVTEYIDNAAIRSYVATKEWPNTFDVTGNTWFGLTNGIHTLKITATDGFATVTRTITFSKSVTKLIAQKSRPIEASTRPSRIVVTLIKSVPYNSNVKVEVCNNGFDQYPAWEEIDTYESGLAHTFANHLCESTINGSSRWGVNIRVTVDRNGGEGACYISEIGGNFE